MLVMLTIKPVAYTVHQGSSQDFTLGTAEAERRKRREGLGLGKDVPLPNRVWGSSVMSSPIGVRGGASAANVFLAYLSPTEH